MRKSKMPETSIEALKSLDAESVKNIYKRIAWALSKLGEGTWEDISRKLKEKDSKIWRRLSEMQRLNMVSRTDNRKVLSSGRKGYTWKLTPDQALTIQDYSRNIQAIANSNNQPQMNKLF